MEDQLIEEYKIDQGYTPSQEFGVNETTGIFRMNPEIKAKWVAALRSGEYTQTTGVLHRDEEKPSYCCLGVLCDIAEKEGVEMSIGRQVNTSGTVAVSYDKDTVNPPLSVQRWANLPDKDPPVSARMAGDVEGPELYSLTQLNDDELLPFDHIAAIIEDQL